MADADQMIEALKVLKTEPGDVVVIRCKQHLTAENAEHLLGVAKSVIKNNKVAILDGGMDIEVLRQAELG